MASTPGIVVADGLIAQLHNMHPLLLLSDKNTSYPSPVQLY